MPRPTDAHKALERLVGHWTGDETMHPSPFDQGGPAVGRTVNRLALDGLAIVQDYEQERGGRVSFRGHGVFRYDAHAREYTLTWFDSMDMPANEFRGGFTGSTLTLTSRGAMGMVRASWDLSVPDRIAYLMEVSGDGTAWMPFIEATYARVR